MLWLMVVVGGAGIMAASEVGVISTVAGGSLGDGGPAAVASLNEPRGVAVDTDGNLFIADLPNHRIRKVEKDTGIIATVAGTGVAGYTGDAGPATSASR